MDDAIAKPDDGNAKQNEVVAILVENSRQILQSVLAETIAEHYSERDWQGIATSFSLRASSAMRKSYELSVALAKSDLYTADGRVNVPSVIAAFEQTEARVTSSAKKAQLGHLIQYLKHSYEVLKTTFRS